MKIIALKIMVHDLFRQSINYLRWRCISKTHRVKILLCFERCDTISDLVNTYENNNNNFSNHDRFIKYYIFRAWVLTDNSWEQMAKYRYLKTHIDEIILLYMKDISTLRNIHRYSVINDILK